MSSLLFQVGFSDATEIADIFLQLSSVYKEDAEVKQVVFEIAGMSEMLHSKLIKKIFFLLSNICWSFNLSFLV